jgi:hypothetical protein
MKYTGQSLKRFAWILASILLGVLGSTAVSQPYRYTSINYPGSRTTVASGINNNGVIVGSYIDTNNKNHGFVYRKGMYVRIDVPNATQTFANGINDYGDIVGTYSLPGTASKPANSFGFLLRAGAFKRIACPGAQFTSASGVNKSGVIVGGCETASGFQGYVYAAGKFRYVNAPTVGSADTQLNGISNTGELAGQVFSGDNNRGFWILGSDFDFLRPYLDRDNVVESVNGRGDIAGCFNGSQAFVSHNPESSEGEGSAEKFPALQPLSPFGSHTACVMGINYPRDIVGWYYDASFKQHGFIGTPQ